MHSKFCSAQDPNFLKLKPTVNCYVNTQACDQNINQTFEKISVITVYFVRQCTVQYYVRIIHNIIFTGYVSLFRSNPCQDYIKSKLD